MSPDGRPVLPDVDFHRSGPTARHHRERMRSRSLHRSLFATVCSTGPKEPSSTGSATWTAAERAGASWQLVMCGRGKPSMCSSSVTARSGRSTSLSFERSKPSRT